MTLRLEGVTVLREGRAIVDDASLEVSPGTLTCIVGPNGAGKSSVLRVLTGLWRPDEGEVRLDGEPLEARSRREIARRVAFVPQDTRLAFEFSVREVVAMGRYPHEGRLTRPGEHASVTEALERTDVLTLADRLVTTLSGGERQRVLLARCLAAQADLLLLDEPTASLDLRHALDVMQLCRSLADDGKGLCLAIHDLNAALRFADVVCVMDKGEVVATGAPRDVLSPERIAAVFGVRAEPVDTVDGRTLYGFEALPPEG